MTIKPSLLCTQTEATMKSIYRFHSPPGPLANGGETSWTMESIYGFHSRSSNTCTVNLVSRPFWHHHCTQLDLSFMNIYTIMYLSEHSRLEFQVDKSRINPLYFAYCNVNTQEIQCNRFDCAQQLLRYCLNASYLGFRQYNSNIVQSIKSFSSQHICS